MSRINTKSKIIVLSIIVMCAIAFIFTACSSWEYCYKSYIGVAACDENYYKDFVTALDDAGAKTKVIPLIKYSGIEYDDNDQISKE